MGSTSSFDALNDTLGNTEMPEEGAGGQFPAPFSADQLTLFQPGGQIMPTTLLPAPQIFGRCGVSVTIS